MKKTILFVVGILVFSGFAVSGTINIVDVKSKVNKNNTDLYSIDDLSARIYFSKMYPEYNELVRENSEIQNLVLAMDYPIGTTIWQYFITGGSDNSVKAIGAIEDIDGDSIEDVIVCSEDYNVRCFSGGEIGTGSVIWTHYIYSGSLNYQNELSITQDIDEDDYDDIVVGTPWGSRSIITLSGLDGEVIWTHDTHEYGGGGWVYQVDSKYDYNNDGVIDVLASTGDDGSDTGPNRAYCLNGLTGGSIWEFPLGGAGFSVIGIEDCNGDEIPDVVAGCTNAAETTGYVKCINGVNGGQLWSFTTAGSSVWALEQVDDVSGDGIKDVIAGDFSGHIYGLSATNGQQLYSNTIGTVIITRFAKLNDVNSDTHPDIVPAHSSIKTTQVIDGQTGSTIWSHATADQPWNAARISDVSGDSIDDVVVGTLYNSNYCYFLNGVDGSELSTISYGEAVDAINTIPDVVNDGSMEMVAGGRNGKLTCISGGLDAAGENAPPYPPIINGSTIGAVGIEYDFTFYTTDINLDNLFYYIDWGDGNYEEWIGPYFTGAEVTVNHSWSSENTYAIVAKAKDEHGAEGSWSNPLNVTIVENEPPIAPIINGTKKGKPGVSYDFTFFSTDPDGNDLYYFVDWDDGLTNLLGPYPSGVEGTSSHSWANGNYTIIAKARDIYGAESDWATLEISIPRNRFSVNFLNKILFERFSKMHLILEFLLNF